MSKFALLGSIHTEMERDVAYAEKVKTGTGRDFHIIYVIGEESKKPVKVGLTNRPAMRLSTLQIGNPRRLYIHDAFWIEGRGAAVRVEHESHQLLADKHDRLYGEWFDCTPDDASDEIEMACLINSSDYFSRMPEISGIDMDRRDWTPAHFAVELGMVAANDNKRTQREFRDSIRRRHAW